MTDRLSTLTRLRDMVRNADEPDIDLDTLIVETFGTKDCQGAPRCAGLYGIGPFTNSIDTAIGLADQEIPGCKIALADIGSRHTAHIKWEGLEAAAYGTTRPLAILDCLLSVLIEKEERDAG